MDVVAHGLWAGCVFKLINFKLAAKKKIKLLDAVFWGIFPDLFSFTIPMAYMLLGLIFGWFSLGNWPHPNAVEPISPALNSIFSVVGNLYNFSHSLVIFFAVIGLIYWATKKIHWSMGAWLLHILIDVPSHSYAFYPTPLFWPISGWEFDGISWANGWFIILNYLALLIVYSVILWKEKRKK